MKRKSIILEIFLLIGFLTFQAHAQAVPTLINYQGRLTDASGAGLSGTKTIEFNIYDDHTGGNLVWGPQIFTDVPLVDGYFNVILGEEDGADRPVYEAFTENNRFIGIKYDGGAEIIPRQQILSAPYALSVDASGIQNTIQDDQLEAVIDREGFHATGNIVADGYFTAPNQARCRVRLSQNKRVDATSPVVWDVSDYVAGNAWDAANGERFFALVDGLYLLNANIISDDDCRMNVYYQNETTKKYLGQWESKNKSEPFSFSDPFSSNIVVQHYMTAGSYLALEPYDGACPLVGGEPAQNTPISFATFAKIQ